MTKVCLYCARYPDEDIETAPLGVAYLAAYLIGSGTISEENLLIADSIDEAIQFKPDILGVSSLSHVIDDAISFATECKLKLNCLTVIGGYHISCIPQKLPFIFDIGVVGEGEITFDEIVNNYNAQLPIDYWIHSLKGVVYRTGNKIKINENRDLISDIDSLPWPYRHRNYSNDIPIFTSRGCPFRCTFCASHKFWRNQIRFRSADSVVKEISYLVEKYQPREIAILDDLWMADKTRFKKIVRGLVDRNINQKVTFRGFCRSNLIQEEDIILLKKMNYRVVRFGAETGSDQLLKKLKGSNISIIDHQRVIDLCKKHGIRCGASFIFGVPGEKIEDLNQTFSFLKKNKNKFSIIGFYYFNPIPGTKLWEELQSKGLIDYDFNLHNLQLDLLKINFRWVKSHYFNEENIDFKEFIKIIAKIQKGFINPNKSIFSLKNNHFKSMKSHINNFSKLGFPDKVFYSKFKK